MKERKKPDAKSVPLQLEKPTEASVIAEAAALGRVEKINVSTVDMLTKTREMLLVRGDVAELQSRDYPVTGEMFERAEILAKLLTANIDDDAIVDERKVLTERAEKARAELLWIREQLRRIWVAANRPEPFEVDTRTYDTLLDSMGKMLKKLERDMSVLSDRNRLQILIARATMLIETEAEARKNGRRLKVVRAKKSMQSAQLKCLLLDQLKHLSKQGLAAFPDDVEREFSYGLEMLNKTSRTKSSDSQKQLESSQPSTDDK